MNEKLNPFKNLRNDIPASIVVFLVALPLCLGIALASGAPLYSGLISGVIGGIVVGALSGSSLGVSGPAAGLAVIVADAITDLGSFEIFLVAVAMAGIIQIILGLLRAGIVAYLVPSSVIHGMLAGIGILIFFKQIPHFFGDDTDPEGDLKFFQLDGENTFTELVNMLNFMLPGAIIIGLISLLVLLLWETKWLKSRMIGRVLPGSLLTVVLGIFIVHIYDYIPSLWVSSEHMVNIPVSDSFASFTSNFAFPDFSAFNNPQVYLVAFVIAIVASLETLLCVDATDKLDPLKRKTPVNRELIAQGTGNFLSGMVGGIPVTQVIVRSSANIQSGGKTKASAVLHGILLLVSVVSFPYLLNKIPMATLAAILMVVGYKLAKPALFKKMISEGWEQALPFFATIIAMLLTDLLIGIGVGTAVALIFIVRDKFKASYKISKNKEKNEVHVLLARKVNYLDKVAFQKMLNEIEEGSTVVIDAQKTHFLHHDVLEILEDFIISAETRNLNITVLGLDKLKIPNLK